MRKIELMGIGVVGYAVWEVWQSIPQEIRETGCGALCIVFPTVIIAAVYLANETFKMTGTSLLRKQFGKESDRRTDQGTNGRSPTSDGEQE